MSRGAAACTRLVRYVAPPGQACACRSPAAPPPRLTHTPLRAAPRPAAPAGATATQALLLVGYDTTRAGQEFLLAKNSFGAAWGQQGTVRLALADGAGQCGLYQRVLQPGAVALLAAPGNGKS